MTIIFTLQMWYVIKRERILKASGKKPDTKTQSYYYYYFLLLQVIILSLAYILFLQCLSIAMKIILTLWILWKGLGVHEHSLKYTELNHCIKQENTLLVFRIWLGLEYEFTYVIGLFLKPSFYMCLRFHGIKIQRLGGRIQLRSTKLPGCSELWLKSS